jgi:hypothetical protein
VRRAFLVRIINERFTFVSLLLCRDPVKACNTVNDSRSCTFLLVKEKKNSEGRKGAASPAEVGW